MFNYEQLPLNFLKKDFYKNLTRVSEKSRPMLEIYPKAPFPAPLPNKFRIFRIPHLPDHLKEGHLNFPHQIFPRETWRRRLCNIEECWQKNHATYQNNKWVSLENKEMEPVQLVRMNVY